MPPRFAYWTIILDGVPTSFRAREQAELLPTFNRLKKKDPTALMKWFSGGRLWDSPEQAKELRQQERVRPFRDDRDRPEKPFQRDQDGRQNWTGSGGGPGGAQPPAGPRPQLEGDDPATVELRRRIAERAAQAPPAPPKTPAPPAKTDDAPIEREHDSRPRAPRLETRRPKGWRPGGDHRDPRDKYKLPPGEARKRWKSRNLGPTSRKPFEPGAGSGGPQGPREPREPGGGFDSTAWAWRRQAWRLRRPAQLR